MNQIINKTYIMQMLNCQMSNVNLIVENAFHIKSGMTTNVGVSAKFPKNIMCAKKFISGILLQVVVEIPYI